MKLRRISLSDIPFMLEWMRDDSVAGFFSFSFSKVTKEDVKTFIENSWDDAENLHLAIASDEDEYMGTVSLKHIDLEKKNAEFAIAVRQTAMSRGYAWFGMEEIIRKAFDEMDLECVYWCVSRENTRACRFYDKHNFHEAVDISPEILARYPARTDLKWYSVLKGDEIDSRESVAGCKVIHIKTVPTLGSGELSFFESEMDIPFPIKRIYYISKVPEGVRRGFHAHKELKQLLFCPYGRIQLILENTHGREEIELSDPSIGVLIDQPTWREMLWLQKDSVLCVAASEYYDKKDYIRDYEEFKKYIR